MNLWVLFLCRFLAKSNVENKKVIVTALLTAVGEVLVLCIPLGSSLIKIILGFGGVTAAAVYWLFRPKSFRYLKKLLIYNYFAVFMLGGILILLESIFQKRKISMLTWAILVVFFVCLIENVYIKMNVKNGFRQVILTFAEGKLCRITALVDSGNGLIEPISKIPVSIVEERSIEKYKEYLQESKFRVVPFHSIGEKHGFLEAYFIEKMEIKEEGGSQIIIQPIIAITKEAISENRNYQMILHPELLKQGGINSGF